MGQVKSDREIDIMKISGRITAEALKKVLEAIKPGVKPIDLDRIAQSYIESQGAKSSFKTVDDYKWTICTTINDQVVHGIPGEKELKDGDIVGIDIGALYHEYHSDQAITIPVGEVRDSAKKFLDIGKQTLNEAIDVARVGNRIGDISETIQEAIEGAGYSIVKNLTGHGVGKELHEEPMVPGFGRKGKGPEIKKGMVLAIEVIYAEGSGDVEIEADGWTISTKDGSLGGLFEKTVAITSSGL